MRRPSRSGLLLVFVLSAITPMAAQNLESVGSGKPLAFAGGLSFNQIFYSSSSGDTRRDPYSYVAAGNVNVSLYGWAIPFSFSVSNRQTSFSQPFNRYSIHPTWKWITVHAGYTSVTFSPYTVNGHIFLGGAIDLVPDGKWKVSALVGRLVKAVPADSLEGPDASAAFQRRGYALKASYGVGGNFINAILFHASDDPHSIAPLPDSLGIHPQENFVVSLATGKTLFDHLTLKAEIASSAISNDITAGKADRRHLMDRAGFLFQPTLTSSYYQAFKSSLDYQRSGWILGLAWERVDPGYRTLGAYYFSNDLENVTLNAAGSLLQGKIGFSSSGGMQRDNLNKAKVSTMRRLVGSLNVTFAPNPRLNLSASYSSFQTYTNIRSQFATINALTPFDNLDTLNFTQIARNATLSGMYFLGKEKKQNVTLNFSWQDAAENQGHAAPTASTRFWNLTTAYVFNPGAKKITIMVAFNGSRNQGASMHTATWGPNAALTRLLFQGKFRTTFATSYNRTYSAGVKINAAMNARLSGAFTMKRKHNVTLSAIMVQRMTAADGAGKSLREFTGTLGYSYSFGRAN